MIHFLIGHRGVGKTSLLGRLRFYKPDAEFYDLDQVIEVQNRASITNIFEINGESEFRRLEKKSLNYLLDLIESKSSSDINTYISLGAGIDLSQIPTHLDRRFIWVKRKTDREGRIFLNRPAFDENLSPLQDYLSRFEARESSYRVKADLIYLMPEGISEPFEQEKLFFESEINMVGAALTLLPENFRSPYFFKRWIKERLDWNLDLFEFRDDLIDSQIFPFVLEEIPPSQIIFSFRNRKTSTNFEYVKSLGVFVDWPLEFGEAPGTVDICSLHKRSTGIFENTLSKISASNAKFLKLACKIENFTELWQGHEWSLLDPVRNIFLPMGGNWHWYRLLMKNRFALNYVREGDGTSSDQPTLMQWMMTPTSVKNFSAVLGNPVEHSISPFEHRETTFFDIRIPSTDSKEFSIALNILKKLGMKNAAVTTPFKNAAFDISHTDDLETLMLKSMNTLALHDSKWVGINTDLPALKVELQKLIQEFPQTSEYAVWGGGGTLEGIKAVVPNAQLYSARTGKRRSPGDSTDTDPKVVIWASGRGSDLANPPLSWVPAIIFDLNYAEDSPAREYAIKTGARYVSGLNMFRIQAKFQKKFWKQEGLSK